MSTKKMKMLCGLNAVVLGLAVVAMMTSVAQAELVMFRAGPGSDMSLGPGDIWNTRSDAFNQAGWAFEAGEDVTINRLGIWIAPTGISGNQTGVAADPSGGTFAQDHTVAIYSFNGSTATLLARTDFAAGTSRDAGLGSSGNGSDQYVWGTISDLDLTSGDDYLVMASYTTAGDALASLNYNAKAAVITPAWGTLSSTGYYNSSEDIPDTVGGTAGSFSGASGENGTYGYIGPNIGYIPEPASILLLLGGLGGLLLIRRR